MQNHNIRFPKHILSFDASKKLIEKYKDSNKMKRIS